MLPGAYHRASSDYALQHPDFCIHKDGFEFNPSVPLGSWTVLVVDPQSGDLPSGMRYDECETMADIALRLTGMISQSRMDCGSLGRKHIDDKELEQMSPLRSLQERLSLSRPAHVTRSLRLSCRYRIRS